VISVAVALAPIAATRLLVAAHFAIFIKRARVINVLAGTFFAAIPKIFFWCL